VSRVLSPTIGVDQRRQFDVRDHAAMLRALSRHAVILADRQRELAIVRATHQTIEREQVLHGPLAEGLLTDDHAAVVVLDRGREDLRRARAEAIDEHGQRTVVDGGRARVVELLNRAASLAQLHDRAALDEQARELGRFR
jgi:predicted GNAT family acetyltransferase